MLTRQVGKVVMKEGLVAVASLFGGAPPLRAYVENRSGPSSEHADAGGEDGAKATVDEGE